MFVRLKVPKTFFDKLQRNTLKSAQALCSRPTLCLENVLRRMKNIRTLNRYATDRMLHKMKLIKIQSHAVHILTRCFYYEKKNDLLVMITVMVIRMTTVQTSQEKDFCLKANTSFVFLLNTGNSLLTRLHFVCSVRHFAFM